MSWATSALPFGDSSTATSRLLLAERLRVTSRMRTSRVTSRDNVEEFDAGQIGKIDLALAAGATPAPP